ncbi:Pls/PosA family non-ribosomal peptide synthetase [Streptomyces sp. NPDC002133]|uniref:Pls/PosA family non-ribosomal peptide synthetase n=1 Tax=Streptomyces sp. NPDC002133 TaxID=3154409 RepID=UPI003318C4EC
MTGKSGGVRTTGKSAGVITADSAETSTIQDGACAGPVAGTAELLAEVLAGVVGVEQVQADSHFFHDLGADSMVMARFCARVRKRADLPSVSMKDIYRTPTIRSLTAALEDAEPAVAEPSVPAPAEPAEPARASTLEYVLCGTLQFLIFLGYVYAVALVAMRGFEWISAGSGVLDIYLRSVLFGGAAFLGACTLPILAKWLLIGRWKPQQIRIWSPAYVRFWVVKTLVRSNPLALFGGSPLYVLYLRALGAKVGRGVVIFSQHVPVCTDLLTIGDGTVIRKDSFFNCYRAHAGRIQTGAVTLGRDVYIGEQTVLDIETSMGDGAQLGHVSSLHAGQAVPAGQGWHGSPAQPTEVDYRMVPPATCGTLRSAVYSAVQVLAMLALYLPLAICILDIFVGSRVEALLGAASPDFTSGVFYFEALAISFVVFFGSLLLSLLFVFTAPRVLNTAIKPDKVYPLYGLHYLLHRAITRMTNSKFLIGLFGDSSYIVPFLRGLGYDLSSPVLQTGSNFGDQVKHDTPYLVSVGPGTVCASELSIINADYSSTSFRVSRASIGAHSFLGNMIAYPSQSKVGDNCLLATKVMVPIDGKVREGVGLLGSPSFEIPRTVERDNRFNHLTNGDELRRRLGAKNRHNALTIGLFLLARWFYTFVAIVIGLCAAALYPSLGVSAIALSMVFLLLFSVVYGVLVERASTGFRPLPPKYCSIYDIDFWRTERFFKLESGVGAVFNGTPFKSAIWRLQGVRLGRRLFDDGCQLAEKNLVTIGDNVTLNAGAWIQCHSQEDYVFKCDHITIGADCTLGVGAFVLYGTAMGDGAVLAPDSFLMKGEEVPPHARWGGNPAREMRTGHGIDNRDVAHFGAKWHQ